MAEAPSQFDRRYPGVRRQATWNGMATDRLDDGVSRTGDNPVSVASVERALRESRIQRLGGGRVVVGEHKLNALTLNRTIESHAVPIALAPGNKLVGDRPAQLTGENSVYNDICRQAFSKSMALLSNPTGAEQQALLRLLQRNGCDLQVKCITVPGASSVLKKASATMNRAVVDELVKEVPVPYSDAAHRLAINGHDVGFVLQYPVNRATRSRRSRSSVVRGKRSVVLGSSGFPKLLAEGEDNTVGCAQAVVRYLLGDAAGEVLTYLHNAVHKNRAKSNSAHLTSAKLAARAGETLATYVEASESDDEGLPIYRKRAGSPPRIRRGKMTPIDADGTCNSYKTDLAVSTRFPTYNRMRPDRRRGVCVPQGPLSTHDLGKFESRSYGYGSVRGVVQAVADTLDDSNEQNPYFPRARASEPGRQEAFERMRQPMTGAGMPEVDALSAVSVPGERSASPDSSEEPRSGGIGYTDVDAIDNGGRYRRFAYNYGGRRAHSRYMW